MTEPENRTPAVLLLAFNRPDLLRRVFAQVRAARPAKLFLAVDGARANRPGEAELCEQCRAVAGEVDWPCVVETRFLSENAGCKAGVSGAISWFFEHVEEGIILEDDCLPAASFFPYCAAMLDHYRDDERVGMISGDNFLPAEEWSGEGHDFSVFTFIWGWATWRRAWRKFHGGLAGWPERRGRGWLRDLLGGEQAAAHWTAIFDRCHARKLDSWAFPWTYSCWVAGMLCAVPACNLVSNIGFDERGTHTRSADSRNASLPTREIAVPAAPLPASRDHAKDKRYLALVFDLTPPPKKKKKLKTALRAAGARFKLRVDAVLVRVLPGRRAKKRRLIRLMKAAERFRPGDVKLDGMNWSYPDAVSFAYAYEQIFGLGIYYFPAKPPARRILDCGANIGLATLYFKKHHPDAEILALEADPKICEYLRTNLARAGVSGGVRVLNRALWNATGEISFASEGADGGHVEPGADGVADGGVRVATVTLAELVGDTEVDFLKVDVEGAECEALIGQVESLRKVRRIFVEYHSYADQAQRLDELLATLRGAGFRVHLHSELISPQPFVWRPDENGMDHRLNIFGWKD